MTQRFALYEVWFSRGHGLQPGPRFRIAHDAERYIHDHLGEAAFAVRAPDGHWTLVASHDGTIHPPR
jgi:hypothetical protein